MTRNLRRVLQHFNCQLQTDLEFEHLQLDSRTIQAGDVFVAINGHQLDGRRYIPNAIAAGAVAVISEAENEGEHGQSQILDGVECIAFWRLSFLLSQLAGQAYFPQGNPLALVAVTGTNGKSTVTHLMASLAQACGRKAAVMGTLGNGPVGQLQIASNTTADAITVQRQLADFAAAGIDLVAMEVSSHGLVQGRVANVPFQAAIFTNLSRDHLDYHGTMAEYGRAKQALFDWPSLEHRIINADDSFGKQLLQHYPQAKGYSLLDSSADWQINDLTFSPLGAQGQLISPSQSQRLHRFTCPLLGRFNVENILAAIACLVDMGYPLDDILTALPHLGAVPGRMELFTGAASVVVDYAHTPDALEKALQAVRQHCQGQLWCIFGCGGDRDKGKRSLMAQAAESLADRIIITDDNPRSEAPTAIVTDIMQGFAQPQNVTVIHQRQSAIAYAIEQCADQDMILLAGKGHEDYQIINGQTLDYNERQVVSQLLETGL